MISPEITRKILQLKDLDRIHLIEILFDSLDRPSPDIEHTWAQESEARYAAYKAGELASTTFDQIVTKYA